MSSDLYVNTYKAMSHFKQGLISMTSLFPDLAAIMDRSEKALKKKILSETA